MTLQTTYPIAPAIPLSNGDSLLESLVVLRKEWEKAAGEDNLLDISASVGLMLVDIATRLNMTPSERTLFLGEQLNQEAALLLAEAQH